MATIHDAVTLFSGKNVITGESVGLGGRAIAAIGLFTPATGGEIRGAVAGYRELRGVIKGTGLEAHHLIEKRFAKLFDAKASEMASIALTREEHQAFTNAWRQAIPYGNGTRSATVDQVLNAAKEIYKDHPTILSALGLK